MKYSGGQSFQSKMSIREAGQGEAEDRIYSEIILEAWRGYAASYLGHIEFATAFHCADSIKRTWEFSYSYSD